MQLNQLQQGLLNMIKQRDMDAPLCDPYFSAIRDSSHIQLVRGIAVWWRSFQIQNFCPLTAVLLKHYRLYNKQVTEFFSSEKYSPFIEEVGLQFLSFVIQQPAPPVIISIASFERALIDARNGNCKIGMIHFDYEPMALIDGLLNNTLTSASFIFEEYYCSVSSQFPELFKIHRGNFSPN